MKTHLTWIRVTAAVVVAGVSVGQAAAQYAPYRPLPPTPAAPAAAPVVAPQAAYRPAPQQAQPVYTAYRTPGAPATAYGSPTGSQYAQPTAAYPQYPQAASPYPQTTSQYPATYGAYPYVAQQPVETMPAPKNMNQSAAQPTPAPMNGAPANATMSAEGMSAAQPGGCNCVAPYGAGSYYNAQGTGCTAGGYPNCDVSNYFGNDCGPDTQWFGGVYFLEMGRTNATPVKLTSQMPTGGAYPYYPQPADTIMTNRDVNFDFREGLEVRVGSTFTIGESCNTCQSGCGGNGCNSGCGCNSCAPATTYAWEVAWWGINGDENIATVDYNGTDRIYGMKSYVGLEHDRDGAGGTYVYRPVNDYYDYEMPITAPPAPSLNYVRVVSQCVRTDFKAQNLELNFIRFPMCDTGCSSGCSGGGCGGGDACGCNSNYTGCNGGCGCDDSCGLGFSMYGSCGVRYFHVDDDFMYGSQSEVYDGAAWGPSQWLYNSIDVKNDLVGPQVGWTSDLCWGKWNLFCNSTFGIFDNHSSVWNRMRDEDGNWSRFTQDGTNFNVRTTKDSVAFLGELRVGTAYDFSCHWRGVIAYRAVAITGLATAAEQLNNAYTDRYTVGLIDSDNAVIIHGAQVGAECRY